MPSKRGRRSQPQIPVGFRLHVNVPHKSLSSRSDGINAASGVNASAALTNEGPDSVLVADKTDLPQESPHERTTADHRSMRAEEMDRVARTADLVRVLRLSDNRRHEALDAVWEIDPDGIRKIWGMDARPSFVALAVTRHSDIWKASFSRQPSTNDLSVTGSSGVT